MARLLPMIGLVAFATLGVAACHGSGPSGEPGPGDMGGMGGEPPMMFQAPTPAACTSPSSAASCAPVETR